MRGDLIFWKGHVGIMSDPYMLIHANIHHQCVAKEPLASTVRRLEALDRRITSVKRLQRYAQLFGNPANASINHSGLL